MSVSGYYRFPTLSGDTIVFVSEDDLFAVPADGGTARRLTANPGRISRPALSPDGATIAYVGEDEGQPEVWVMPLAGGSPRRLTWLGGMTQVAGWRPDGSAVLLASDTGQPFPGWYHLHEASPDGGPVRPLNLGPAASIAFEPGGKGVVLGRNTADPARWKRYRGGTAGVLFIDRSGRGKFERFLDLDGNLAAPMWIGGRIVFLSDHEGIANLYACRPDGSDLERLTDHDEFYVRWPATDGKRVVYAVGADLWLLDPETGESARVPVDLPSARPERSRKFVDAARWLESFDIHPDGHSLAVTSRGKPFSFALWEGAVAQHGEPDGVRYRHAKWLPDGKTLVAVSDESGEEELVLLAAGARPKRVKLADGFGRVTELAVAPAGGKRVAIANHRYEVIVVDLAKKEAKVVDRSRHDRIKGLAFSPDGRWLAYGYPTTLRTSGIRLHDTRTGKTRPVTRPDFKDGMPAFDPDGKYLYFVSFREYDPVYDNQVFDLGFPRGGRLMVLPLTKGAGDPFEPSPRAPSPPGTPPKGGKKEDEKKKEGTPAVKIDFAGIEDRLLAFPVPEGNYGRILGISGKVLFSSYPIEGALGQSWAAGGAPPARGELLSFDFAEQKKETLVSGITDFAVEPSTKVLVYRAGNRLRAVPAGPKPDAAAEGKPAGRESGWIDLGRVRLAVRPPREWAQMYGEAWRLMRDQFWTEDMSGTDWQRVHDRYRPLLDRVGTRSEFSDLLWEMQGELGTSHAYELGGDYRPQPGWHQGHLGADLEWDGRAKAWRITRIPRGDSWNEAGTSPLAAPGVGLGEGDRILAVDGRPVDGKTSPGERLVHRAAEHVELTVAKSDGKGKRDVVVRTMRSEQPLRYRDWVESNREFVHGKSKGRVGYVHVPNMGPAGYAEFHRYFVAELDHEGLVVDVRHNGGGHVSPLLLEKLLRRRVGYDTQRWGDPVPYPSEAVMGPLVALTNERAGSDGDIFSHCFKLYGLGPLIGKRTWGGVIGIWPRHALVDGTITTQPEFSFWFEDVGFGVENYGTDPDIEVENHPQDYRRGRDRQLERGVAEILKMLKEKPPVIPDLSKRPKLGLPKLPKRG